jgi:hypothetical protein
MNTRFVAVSEVLAAKWLLILASFLGFCPSIMSGFRT